jgi:hypothetical protein
MKTQSTPRGPNSRTRTVITILLIVLGVMIIMDIFARRRAAAAIRSQRDISLVDATSTRHARSPARSFWRS